MEIANTFDPPRMPTYSEMRTIYNGDSLTNKVTRTGGSFKWAKRLGLPMKQSETKLGVYAEKYVANLLRSSGFTVEETPVRHPYDLLVDGCVKIDVKAANISYVRNDKIRAYRLSKRQPTCDFYVLCEIDDEVVSRIFVVPSSVVSGQTQIEMGFAKTKYAKYIDKYSLISDAVTFFKSLCS